MSGFIVDDFEDASILQHVSKIYPRRGISNDALGFKNIIESVIGEQGQTKYSVEAVWIGQMGNIPPSLPPLVSRNDSANQTSCGV